MNSLRHALRQCSRTRQIHTSARWNGQHGLFNIISNENPPPVQVRAITPNGIELHDGLVMTGPCVFLEGEVFLWDTPSKLWEGWTKDHFRIFDVVTPKPEILLLGTGTSLSQPPPDIRKYINGLGIQVDAMDTRNACSYYNLLAEEGRHVAAALIPLSPKPWTKTFLGQ
ncbi:DUF498-domain-containing protein [Cylindrobasidium torrendii FP15055 ss-10]|uniref:NADH dehydrogenase [ubiquinone] 1 alpha subcomplex assembly factor 3 n=1 Tax=Cylindrobasidium torrendii FP15055 ss-10 TaxID=1314674 RepID=A0A0D7BWA3_9AGAR|nr:DUF498-domain-containing protein [Cylindrobasidium torrendii FP15055 ss-10]